MKFVFFVLLFLGCFTLASCSDQNQALVENKPFQSDDNNAVINNDSEQPSPIPSATDIEKDLIILDIPIINQNPELKYGCEVTSLAMVLQHAGIETDKLKLADELPKDEDPIRKTNSGDITSWGNPDHGFVGDMTGKSAGYAVYAGPLEKVMNRHLQNRTVNLTGKPFDEILSQIKKEKLVILWTTGDYKLPDRWESWKHANETINTPLDLHAVVLVGFDKEHLYLNDPLTGEKSKKTKKDSFLESWEALGQQALSYN